MSLSLATFSHGLTVEDLIDRTIGHLYGNQRTALNVLDASMTTATTSMTLTDSLDGIRAGAYIEVDDEVMYVRSATGAVATVRRGMLGTDAAAHVDESLVKVEPRFRRQQIIQALRAEIESWPFTVYARYVGEVSVGTSVRGVDLAGLAGVDGAQLIAAQRSPLESNQTVWPTIPSARLERRQDLTDYPSGYALVFPNFGGNIGVTDRDWPYGYMVSNVSSFTARVRVKARFSTAIFSAGTDVGQVMGMPLACAEIAPVGAAARLVMTQDVARTDTNAYGRARAAEEVRAGDATSAGRSLLQWRDRLLDEAAKSLFMSEDSWVLQT